MSVYVVNGYPGSGKTSFEFAVVRLTGGHELWTHILSTITPIKEIAAHCGWNWTKTPRDRKFLSDLKDLLTEYNNYSFNWIKQKIAEIEYEAQQYGVDSARICIFVDCREPDEIKKLCDAFGAKSVLVRRPETEVDEFSNHADAEVMDYEYDIVVDNDGDLDHLDKLALKFIGAEGIGPKNDKC